MRIDERRDPHNTPDLTAGAAESVRAGSDVRRLTAGYDTGDQREDRRAPADSNRPPAVADDGTVDLDTGLDFGAFGGRDVGTDVGADAMIETD